MVHPAALAISLGIVIGGAIFALFYVNNNRNTNHGYVARGNRDPLELIQGQLESESCSICLERFDNDDIFLECYHRFHQHCIEQSLRHSNLCPNCRQPAKILQS